MIHAIRIWWTGSAVIANASGRSFIIAANAVSNSMRGLTLTPHSPDDVADFVAARAIQI
jgi:hypothetical protein